MLSQESLSKILIILSKIEDISISRKICILMTEPNNKQKQADLLFFTTRTDGMGRFLSSGNDMVNVGRILQIVEDSEKEKIELEKESTP